MASHQKAEGRPRTRSIVSHESKKSHKSRGSDIKVDLHETSKDKFRITGKADPSQAMNELQPAAVALEKSTLGDLRRVSYVGRNGQTITEADASNPTRYRWERPLDTIRGFEEDINRTYKEKQSTQPPTRPQSRGDMYGQTRNRRSSYAGGYNNQPTSPGGGYYGGYENGGENEYAQNQGQYAPNNYGPQSRGGPPKFDRGMSEPMMARNGERQPYHNYQQSRETVATTAPSPDTDMQPYSTNPSSQNSSFDHFGAPAAPPKYPAQNVAPSRPPMRLDTGVDRDGAFEPDEVETKKKSWLKKRFSKN